MVDIPQAGGLARRRLAYQQPIQTKQKEVYVYSEKELIDAIGSLVIETKNYPGLSKGYFPGKTVKIGKGFNITSTIVIPTLAIGLCLDGMKTSLVPSSDGMVLFESSSPFLTIKDFALTGADSIATAFFGTLVKLKGFSDNVRILDNTITAAKLVDGTLASSLSKIIIRGNMCEKTTNPIWVDLVEANGVISGNCFTKSGGATNIGVRLGTNCARVAVVGNSFRDTDIITNTSGGFNTVVGNTDLGTTALAGTDSNLGNT
jgi:hypothetical protein